MKKTKLDTIVCPSCGREYLPAEIFIPKVFFGCPNDIERNSLGKIISYSGNSIDSHETYICDGCKTPFNISAEIQFVTDTKDKYNFSEAHTTKIVPSKISLKEE